MGKTLHEIFEGLAEDTWERLRDARTMKIRFGEETITDLLLLELKRLGSGQIHIIQTPKYLEQTSGLSATGIPPKESGSKSAQAGCFATRECGHEIG
jgi:hypothetical protein